MKKFKDIIKKEQEKDATFIKDVKEAVGGLHLFSTREGHWITGRLYLCTSPQYIETIVEAHNLLERNDGSSLYTVAPVSADTLIADILEYYHRYGEDILDFPVLVELIHKRNYVFDAIKERELSEAIERGGERTMRKYVFKDVIHYK